MNSIIFEGPLPNSRYQKSLSQDDRVVRPQWNRIQWSLSLFIGKHWRFGAGNKSCRATRSSSYLKVYSQREREGTEPNLFFFLLVFILLWFFFSTRQKGKRVRWDVWKHSSNSANLCDWVCPHAEEGKPYLLEPHPCTSPPNPLPHIPPALYRTHHHQI